MTDWGIIFIIVLVVILLVAFYMFQCTLKYRKKMKKQEEEKEKQNFQPFVEISEVSFKEDKVKEVPLNENDPLFQEPKEKEVEQSFGEEKVELKDLIQKEKDKENEALKNLFSHKDKSDTEGSK